jgi:transcriptional regulator of NAD metabolism
VASNEQARSSRGHQPALDAAAATSGSPPTALSTRPPAERRQQIVALLGEAALGLTGAELAQRLGVSRQIIVQDVAVLRAAGEEILATPQGYVLAGRLRGAAYRRVVACRHTREQVEDELTALVDAGVTVVDVIVEHPLYGELRAPLWLRSRADVANFMAQLERTRANLLSSLTNGVHLHTLAAAGPAALEAARQALARRGYLLTG